MTRLVCPRLLPVLGLMACTGAPTAEPPQPEAIPEPLPAAEGVTGSYTLTFPDAASQMMDVELVLPGASPETALAMANWTPGSYAIRDYARHLQDLSLTIGGAPAEMVKSAKNTWVPVTKPTAAADWVVRYRVYAHDDGVRGNWVEPDYAVLNGAPTYLTDMSRNEGSWDVRIVLPDAWNRISTGLPAHPSGEDHRFRAASYDQLVDSPVVLGDHAEHSWIIADPVDSGRAVQHRIVHQGATDTWDVDSANKDVERVAQEVVAFWRGVPYRDYVFQNIITGGYGGLEHRNSTLMTASAWVTDSREARVKWLGLVSHEFFHTWNVKRLRPAELGPFDYETEVHTRGLWVAEGITSYYDDLLVARADLMTDDEYLIKLSKNLKAALTPPGRNVRSLEDASFDAWIKYYRKDENHDNVSVSYYTKGAAVAWMLDAELRDRSGGYATLDDAMRLAYSRHSREAGFTSQQFQAACEDSANLGPGALADFFDNYVRGTTDIDTTTALRVFGLTMGQGSDAETDPQAWLGVDTYGSSAVAVRRVIEGGPAWNADLLVGDEIIAVNQHRVPDGGLDDLIGRFQPNTEVTLTIARRGLLREVKVSLANAKTTTAYELGFDGSASIEARETRKQWLQGSQAPATAAE